jgi:cell pole-organizing protein PopZ
MSAGEFDQRKETTAKASSGIASAEVASPAQVHRRNDQLPLSAADRAARIAALYASGDTAGAEAALREFRAANPDADTYLPASLRDWARTVE